MLVDVAESYQVECWLMLQATLFSYRQHRFPHTAQLWQIWGVQLLTQHGCHCHDKLSLKTPGWENMYASRTTVTTWFLSIFKICTFLNRSWNIRRNVKYTHTHTHITLSLPACSVFICVTTRMFTQNAAAAFCRSLGFTLEHYSAVFLHILKNNTKGVFDAFHCVKYLHIHVIKQPL